VDYLWLGSLGLAAVWIWLRDRSWWDSASDVLPVLAALPLGWWLAQPLPLRSDSPPIRWNGIGLAVVATVIGIALNLTLALAAGWTLILWSWLERRIAVERQAALRRLIILPFLAFPWVTLDLTQLGWGFRWSGAWLAEQVFRGAGLMVTRNGTAMVVQGAPISVDASCAGLKVLPSLLIAGTLLGYVLLGRSRRYWWNLALLPGLAWLANSARILAISIASLSFGQEFAMGLFHTWGGLFVLLLMFGLCWFVFQWQAPKEPSP
jgi:exosortase/archaeosortase family protein